MAPAGSCYHIHTAHALQNPAPTLPQNPALEPCASHLQSRHEDDLWLAGVEVFAALRTHQLHQLVTDNLDKLHLRRHTLQHLAEAAEQQQQQQQQQRQ